MSSFDPQQPYASADSIAHPPSRSPWRWVLLGCGGVLLLMCCGVIGMGWGTYRFLTTQLVKYTSETAKELPVVEISDEAFEEIQRRFEPLEATNHESAAQPPPAQPIVLTADEINAMIARNEDLRGRVYVSISEDQISAEISFPIDEIPGGAGRFLNASATAEASLSDGQLVVKIVDAEVNGNPIPEPVMQGLRNENFAKDIQRDPKAAEALQRFESLRIENDRVILVPRLASPPDQAGEPSLDPVSVDPPQAEPSQP